LHIANKARPAGVVPGLTRNPFLSSQKPTKPATHGKLSGLMISALTLVMPIVCQAATLTAYAVLPADTFVPGSTSGQLIKPVNDRKPPFMNQQPVQGFSAVVQAEKGSFFILSDNGFGRRDK